MEAISKREAWNKGKPVGKKPAVKPKDIWAIRIHFQKEHAFPDLAMFNLAIDSTSFAAVTVPACWFATSRMGTRFSRLSPGSW